jgi:hypothetical protein
VLLHVGIMHSDRTSSDFNPVQDEIVVLTTNLRPEAKNVTLGANDSYGN